MSKTITNTKAANTLIQNVDNRESVATLPELNTQIFNLIVSPKDTKLRVELIDAEGEEA